MGRPSYLGLTRSISWLLMPWLLTSRGHLQPWYWLSRICRSWSYLRGRILTSCVISMWSNDIKCIFMFMFPLKNLACKGLTPSTLNHRNYPNRGWLISESVTKGLHYVHNLYEFRTWVSNSSFVWDVIFISIWFRWQFRYHTFFFHKTYISAITLKPYHKWKHNQWKQKQNYFCLFCDKNQRLINNSHRK